MSVQVSYKKQFVFGLILIVTLLLIIELVSYVVLNEKDSCVQSLPMSGIYPELSKEDLKKLCKDYQSIIMYEHPYKFWEPNQHTETVNINNDGFRGDEISASKENNKYRIFFLGGSTAYGVYATKDSSTIPGNLQKIFTNNGYNVEVINAGVNGADSLDETYTIKNKLIKYNPDMMIAYDGWNDLWSPVKEDIHEITTYDKIFNKFTYISGHFKTDEFFFFINRIIIKNIYGDKGSPIESIDYQQSPRKSSLWEKRWSEVCSLGQENNFRVIISLQPVLGSGNKTLTTWESTIKHNLIHQSVVPSYHFMKDSLLHLDANCDLTIDLTNVFDERSETIFQDNGHMGDVGNGIIAQKIYEKILPIVLEDLNNKNGT